MQTGHDVVHALAISPQFDHDKLCFAARHSGLYRSRNGGATWEPACQSLALPAPFPIASVCFSPNFIEDRSVFAGAIGSVLRSSDAGGTWELAGLPAPPSLVSALAVFDDTLFAGTLEDGLMLSPDRGEHWSAWNFGLLDARVLCMAVSPDFASDHRVYIGTESGIFVSTTGGRSWRETGFPVIQVPVLSMAIACRSAEEAIVFAGTEGQGLYCSRDSGQTWQPIGPEVIGGSVSQIVLQNSSLTEELSILLAHSDDLMVSRDTGRSWANWPAVLPESRTITAVAAPFDLDAGALLLVGLEYGQVLRV